MHHHTWSVRQQRSRIFNTNFFGDNSDLGLGIYTVLDSGESLAALITVDSDTVLALKFSTMPDLFMSSFDRFRGWLCVVLYQKGTLYNK